jgi:hypothetical protein
MPASSGSVHVCAVADGLSSSIVHPQLPDAQRQMKRSNGPTAAPPSGQRPSHSAPIVHVLPSCAQGPEGRAALVSLPSIDDPHNALAFAFGPQCGVHGPAFDGPPCSYEKLVPFGHRGASLHGSTK